MDTFEDFSTWTPDDESVVPSRRRSLRLIPLLFVGAVVLAAVVVGFQRYGTIANASVVETTKNLAGGFLAVGMTKEQPGFILVSKLDQKDVSIDTQRSTSKLAGTHTHVYVKTATQHWNTRLRKPLVITIGNDGTIKSSPLNWTLYTFHMLRDAVDCSQQASLPDHALPEQKRCGAPFLYLKERIEKWPPETVPECLSEFLASR